MSSCSCDGPVPHPTKRDPNCGAPGMMMVVPLGGVSGDVGSASGGTVGSAAVGAGGTTGSLVLVTTGTGCPSTSARSGYFPSSAVSSLAKG